MELIYEGVGLTLLTVYHPWHHRMNVAVMPPTVVQAILGVQRMNSWKDIRINCVLLLKQGDKELGTEHRKSTDSFLISTNVD